MPKGNFYVPVAANEPVRAYAPNSEETQSLISTYKKMWSESIEVPQYIGKELVKSGNIKKIHPPHDHQHVVGIYHEGDSSHVRKAIDEALKARTQWANMKWEHRASIFLKAADLLAGPYRDKMNAATMIGQGKNVHQAEIDASCEFIDFLRFNVQFMTEIYEDQPICDTNIWNRVEYRPLEGFLYAITPFNFTAIAGNLPSCMALMGNVVVWKPSDKQVYSAQIIMEVFREAGLPEGVINMILTEPIETTKIILEHPDFAGIHFTGSTNVFQQLWLQMGQNIKKYKTYPRIVGETGGKDFVLAHKSAKPKVVAANLVRGAFEFQGQKCSAASRAYISNNLWDEVSNELKSMVGSIKMGSPEDPSNFVNAVISKYSFDKIAGYIDRAKESNEIEILIGGSYDDSKGYFVEPTILVTTNPYYESMVEEIFGPVLTIYVYDENKWEETLKMVDATSPYGLTGAIFSQDRNVIEEAAHALQNSAGNFYINDKPTGAVVGQQPFGGARLSGTNDKAGAAQNLMRWVSARTIKENFVPAEDYRYPFLG